MDISGGCGRICSKKHRHVPLPLEAIGRAPTANPGAHQYHCRCNEQLAVKGGTGVAVRCRKVADMSAIWLIARSLLQLGTKASKMERASLKVTGLE